MFTSLLAAALAMSTPAPPVASVDDVVTSVCIARFTENVALVAHGEEPNSLVIPLIGLDDAAAAALTKRCDMFDRGIAFAMTVRPQVRIVSPPTARQGLEPDAAGDLSRFFR